VVKIDFMAMETDSWLYGTRAFLEAMTRAVAEAERLEEEELKRRAAAENWPPEEYFAEQDVLREKFGHWLPRLSAYSVIILLQSLVETQLHAYGRRLRRVQGIKLDIADLQGKGITPAQKYITKVAGIDIANDLGWQELCSLQDLRNIIVHRRGRQGSSEQQKVVRRLMNQYPEDLSLRTLWSDPEDHEVLVTFRLCSHLLEQVEAFFRRLCKAAGFQEKGWSS
jgi:hypothetical protein